MLHLMDVVMVKGDWLVQRHPRAAMCVAMDRCRFWGLCPQRQLVVLLEGRQQQEHHLLPLVLVLRQQLPLSCQQPSEGSSA